MMIHVLETVLALSRHPVWFAQVPGEPLLAQTAMTSAESALAFLSGPQFFIALIAGVVMAFAFQFLLTNFSIASDISTGVNPFDTDADGIGKAIRTIEVRVGAWTIFIVNVALFIACFLAVKLTLIQSVTLAAIVSVVIWSVYFLILLWAGSRAIGALAGSVGSMAGASLQGVMGMVATALGGRTANAQIVNTVEASVEAVTKELGSALAPARLRENVSDYLSELQVPDLNLNTIRRGFETLLKNSDLASIANSDLLQNINRETFVNLIRSRTDLSQRDVERIADQLEAAWNRVVGGEQPNLQADLLRFVQTASPEELRSGALRDRIQQLTRDDQSQGKPSFRDQALQTGLTTLISNLGVEQIADQVDAAWSEALQQASQSEQQATLLNVIQAVAPGGLATGQLRDQLKSLLGNGNGHDKAGGRAQTKIAPAVIDALISALSERVDLSDLDVDTIAGQLNSLRHQLTDQAGRFADVLTESRSRVTIQTDIENYLLNSPRWYLNPEGLDHGFREVIYDPEADPSTVRQQLASLDRGYFVDVLRRREGFPLDQVSAIADLLEVVRQEVLITVREAEEQEKSQNLRHRVEQYLHTVPKEELTSEGIQRDFMALLADPDASYETLGNRLIQFDRDTLMQLLLAERQDLSQPEAEEILNQIEGARDRFLNESQENWNRLQAEAADVQQRVESYLRETNLAELTPEALQRDLRSLLESPQMGVSALRSRLAHVNRDTLVQILSQRGDLSEEQINRTLDQIESVRDSLLHAPQQFAEQAQEQYDRLITRIGDYLRNTNLEELNPEGLQRDLSTLLDDPQAGVSALRSRLAQVDRETLVKLLSQRDDLSEEQVNRTIDQVQDSIRSIVRAPRRFVVRTRDRVRDLPSDLADYLRNTKKEELNPEGIQRDLQLLLKQPRAGLESLSDRVSQFDRSTLVALLSQREDISEEEANQIADQIGSVRDQLVGQVKATQQRIQSVIDGVFARIRDSLNSLERPELNYEGIQHDLRQLFDDPQAGLEALRDRLGQFDRETLVALLSSRPDISEADANRIVDRIESVRDNVLSRAERIQEEAEKRITALKHKAKEQAEEVQKAVAIAAWWLFGTAITSVASAAIAGALAVRGFSLFG